MPLSQVVPITFVPWEDAGTFAAAYSLEPPADASKNLAYDWEEDWWEPPGGGNYCDWFWGARLPDLLLTGSYYRVA